MSSLRAAIALGALLTAAPRWARAQAPVLPILLDSSGCEALAPGELERLLAVEFHTLNVEPREPLESVHVVCGPSVARVTIDGGDSLNEVALAATAPAAWPRLLALSVSEIVIRSRASLPRVPAAAPAKPAAVSAEPAMNRTTQGAPTPLETRVSVAFALRRVFADETWLSGPALGIELPLGAHLSLAGDLRLELGATETELARVHWLSTRGALALLLGGRAGAWRLSGGPGACLGYVRLSPTVTAADASGHAVSGAWAGPQLLARADYDFATRWFAHGGLDVGWVTLPVSGLVDGNRSLIDGGGAWLSSELGIGARF